LTLVGYGAESVLGIDLDGSQFKKHEGVKKKKKLL
jgi:hypothetical protein|tara:strand:- start:5240 stop:5344 length:105 start_codon:yes stop_codon:yes gene_type:complete